MTAPPPTLQWFESIGQMLDGLGIGMCLFDLQDCTLVWNDTFLRFFPEHAGHMHAGEHYGDNLRRFYQQRLGPDEIGQIEHYVAAGIARHHDQTQPFAYEHRGRQLRVASLLLERVGRMRLWCPWTELASASPSKAPASAAPSAPAELLDRIPSGLMLCDGAGRIQWVNTPFVQMYGLADAQAAQGQTLADVYRSAWARFGMERCKLCTQHLQTLPDALRFTGAPFELALPHGQYCRVLAQPSTGNERLYAHTDITELKGQQARLARAEAAARESAAQLARNSAVLQATLHNMEQGIAMVNAQGRIEYFNQRVLDLLDLPHALLAGQPLLSDVIEYQRAQGEFDGLPPETLARLANGLLPGISPVLVRQRPNGLVLETRSIPVQGGGMLRTFSDVTERHQHQERMEHLASHDGLTGLLNRSKFMECLHSESALAQRTHGRYAVLYLDLDGFKPINDSHGHAAGDAVLVHVAQTLRRIARVSDFVARLGGDEFAVLQRGIDTPDQASALAARLASALAAPIALAYGAEVVGASIGIALYPENGSDPTALLAHADHAMYLAKAGGKQSGSLANVRRTPRKP